MPALAPTLAESRQRISLRTHSRGINMAPNSHARIRYGEGAMAAYVLVNVEITDSAGFAEYRKLVPATIAAFGGRFLTRGGATEVLEGEWQPHRLVIIEFPDVAAIKAWYHSPEYQRLLELRKRTATSDLVILDGV
jgi:uncharacterized protein (DUF1330 family)